MIHKIKSSLACFLYKVHQSDSDDMDEHHNDLFPLEPEHITRYCRTLEMINNTIGTKQLQSYQIPKFEGLKTLALSQHEYGRANVQVPSKKIFPSPIALPHP
jgi:hypothetical protein